MTAITYHVSDNDAAIASLSRIIPRNKARAIVASYPGLRGLSGATIPQLVAVGLTRPQAGRIVGAFELARVAATQAADRGCRVLNPASAADRVRRAIGSEGVECFGVLLLNSRQEPIDFIVAHRGTLSQVDVHPREIFRAAIQCGAHSILIAHNHPSGDPAPSSADHELTERLCSVGRTVGIPVVDHLVVTPDACSSFANMGVMPA